MKELKIKLYNKECLPRYSAKGDAALDCFCSTDTDWYIQDGIYRINVPLGFGIECPRGYSIFVMSRSGIARKQNISLINSVGVGDSTFGENEYQVMLTYNGITQPETIKAGTKICQILLIETPEVKLNVVDSFYDKKAKDGFGSSGNK